MGLSRDGPNFLVPPSYYLRNGKSYGFQIWPVHSEVHPNKSPLNIFEKRESGRIQGLSNFFSGRPTPIISGTGKATDFKFGQYIQRVHPNKSPLKILEKRECVSQERVKLGTSNIVGSIGTKNP